MGLLLQKPHLFSNDCQLAARCGPGELIGLLHNLGQLDQVELVLLPNLVRAHQLEATWGLLSWHQVHSVLEVWRLWVKHHQFSLLMTAVVDVSHSCLNMIALCARIELFQRSTANTFLGI